MNILLILFVFLLGINVSADITGKAKITDGDSIIINDIRIRFTEAMLQKVIFGKTQTCLDAEGNDWECGNANAKLKELLITKC